VETGCTFSFELQIESATILAEPPDRVRNRTSPLPLPTTSSLDILITFIYTLYDIRRTDTNRRTVPTRISTSYTISTTIMPCSLRISIEPKQPSLKKAKTYTCTSAHPAATKERPHRTYTYPFAQARPTPLQPQDRLPHHPLAWDVHSEPQQLGRALVEDPSGWVSGNGQQRYNASSRVPSRLRVDAYDRHRAGAGLANRAHVDSQLHRSPQLPSRTAYELIHGEPGNIRPVSYRLDPLSYVHTASSAQLAPPQTTPLPSYHVTLRTPSPRTRRLPVDAMQTNVYNAPPPYVDHDDNETYRYMPGQYPT
jgi:hypothetical protein